MPRYKIVVVDTNREFYEGESFEAESAQFLQIDYSKQLAISNSLIFPDGRVVLINHVVSFRVIEVKDD